jgi:Fe/S biogenesis protein NfuA
MGGSLLRGPLGFRQKKASPGDGDPGAPVVSITPAALETVLGIRSGDADPERLALWVEITGEAGQEYTYDMYLLPLEEAGPEDVVVESQGLPVVVPVDSVPKVTGATIDFQDGGLWLDNPNKAGPPLGMLPIVPTPAPSSASPAVGSHPPADLSGDVAQRVIQVLDRVINPQIAAHGGRADLVAVEDGAVYLRLGGGCQGCGMATVTLSQGIEVAIKEAAPEISRVVDVTDHQSGTNPYFQPSKK